MNFISKCIPRSYSKLPFDSLRHGQYFIHKISINRRSCLVNFIQTVPTSRLITTSSFHPAGHSHYENTRHIKAAKDQAKHGIINTLIVELDVAIRGKTFHYFYQSCQVT